MIKELKHCFGNKKLSMCFVVSSTAKKQGLDDISSDVANLVSHATQERLRDLLEKLDTIAEHRIEIYKVSNRELVKSICSTLLIRTWIHFNLIDLSLTKFDPCLYKYS